MALNTVALSILICIASVSWALPMQRERRSPDPAHSMMVHGYLLRNPSGGYLNPHIGMTAYASRFYNSRTSLVNENPEAEPPAEDKEVTSAPEEAPMEPIPEDEQASERTPKAEQGPTPAKPTRKAPKTPKRRPAEDEEDDDDDSYSVGRRNVPGGSTYSNFFPIVFGSRSTSNRRSGDGDEDDAIQGPGLTAIANSFSTGRGAIAASHATAYGGPAPNPLRKSSPSRYRS